MAIGEQQPPRGAPGPHSESTERGGPSAGAAAGEPLSFERAAERLSAIVQQLESGELALEQSLALFEEGVRVARAAQARLDQAERRVEELLGLDRDGKPRTRELERE